MKIVATSNFNLEHIAERIIATGITAEDAATCMCDALNAKFSNETSTYHYKIVEDDYKLWRGMEELI